MYFNSQSILKRVSTLASLTAVSVLAVVSTLTVYANAGTVLVDDTATTTKNTSVSIDVFANDTGVDEYSITVGDDPSYGSVVKTLSDGNYVMIYYPDADYTGPDSFTYTDGQNSATVSVTVEEDMMDNDGDGTSDSQESGDVNNDGIQDSEQANVAVVSETEYVVLDGCDVAAFGESATALEFDENQAQTKILGFTAEDCTTVTVTIAFGIEFSSYQNLTNPRILKYGLNSSDEVAWFDFTDQVTLSNVNGMLVGTYTLTDGGVGDSAAGDGMIVDPIVVGSEDANLVRTGGIF